MEPTWICRLAGVVILLLAIPVPAQDTTTTRIITTTGRSIPTTPAPLTCDEDEFLCGTYNRTNAAGVTRLTAECVPKSWACDGEPDCTTAKPEGTDELPELCACKPDQLSCDDECYPGAFKCDRFKDCTTYEDESGCVYPECPEGHFYCGENCDTINATCSHQCIPPEQKCNGVFDCFDGRDESDILCKNEMPKCPKGLFRCDNGNCIDPLILCNGDDDCGDNSDEALCNINECKDRKLNNCTGQGKCINLNVGFECRCDAGYKLFPNNTCVEIDECMDRPMKCSQDCVNKKGSYQCSCHNGYKLAANKKSCKHTDDQEPWLLIGNRYQIRKMSLDGKKFDRANEGNEYVHVVDYDYDAQKIYFADVVKSEIRSMTMNGSDEKRIIWHGLPLVEGLAIDWINKKIYWTDSSLPGVFVAETNGTHVKELHSARTRRPRAIVLHPRIGYLYWSDWSLGAFIGRMGMDGSNMVKLVEERLFWPNALTIDYSVDRFWWADAHLDIIETAKLDGTDRLIVRKSVPHIYAVTVFEDWVYWTDWNIKTIEKANRLDGSNRSVIRNTTSQPYDIHVVHPLRQPKIDIPNPCANDNGGCSHLCLLAPGTEDGKPSFACACPKYFIMNADKKTCTPNCTDAQFQCGRSDHRCIPLRWKCDNETDCQGGEDEMGCPPRRCPARKFECVTGTSIRDCVDQKDLCDGQDDCADKSDEDSTMCAKMKCLPNEFKCKRGKCVPKRWHCDGDDDCGDKSDEGPECDIPKNCTADQFRCDNGKCIHKLWFCDYDDDCGDRSDEPRDICARQPCLEGWRRCQTNYRCIPTLLFCDGNDDCRDKSDERLDACPVCETGNFQCDNKKCIPERWRCDFENDCSDNSDEDKTRCEDHYRPCEEGEFRCDNKKCIRSRLRCDHKNDCGDDSDERECQTHTCPERMFRCNSGHCILESFRCDGDKDCEDVSDEVGCSTRYPDGSYCRETEFNCKNTVCLRTDWVCDGDDDCGDNSDEDLTYCADRPCPSGARFRCNNHICIPRLKICDGVDNCRDGSDENNFTLCTLKEKCQPNQFECINRKCVEKEAVCNELDDCGDNSDEHGCHVLEVGSCSASNGGCEKNCTQVEQRYYCSCPPGYRIDPSNKKMCRDENECLRWGNDCPQQCENLKGSYLCTCQSGFASEMEGKVHRCRPKRGSFERLLIAVENDIRLYKNARREYTDAVNTNGRVKALDVDGFRNLVYWTDTTHNQIFRAKVPFNNSQEAFPVSLNIAGLLSPEGVAVDWLHRNIYYTDATDGRIMVAKDDGRYPRTLIGKSRRRPTAIAVSPQNGLMFWVDPTNSKIESAWMDGTNIKQVASTDLIDPTSIVVDHYQYGDAARLYWADQKRQVIESAHLDGTDRMVVADRNLSSPSGIDVFGAYLYWVSRVNGTLREMDKFGRGVNVTRQTGLVFPQDVKMMHQQKQPQGPGRCANKGCSHLCVAIPNGAKCMCPENTEFQGGNPKECDAATTKEAELPRLCVCRNGGTCINRPEGHSCSCRPGFRGKQCESQGNPPTPGPQTRTSTTTFRPEETGGGEDTSPRIKSKEKSAALVAVILPIILILLIVLIVIIIIVVLYRRGTFKSKKSGHGEFRPGAPGEENAAPQNPYENVVHYNANDGQAHFSNPIYDEVNPRPGPEPLSAQEYAEALPAKQNLA